jgi:sterol desaturase/sphingolipid hydroxylase (fatty acid hydroxylase superfamily)
VCFSFISGLAPQSVTIFLLVSNFFSIFQHANIKTPTWIGYVIQRPESHAVHHAKGVHAYNYSDLPLLDIIFGTFKNPDHYVKETGFYHGASARIKIC